MIYDFLLLYYICFNIVFIYGVGLVQVACFTGIWVNLIWVQIHFIVLIVAAPCLIRLLVLVNKDGKEEEPSSFYGRVNRRWSCWKDDFWGIIRKDKTQPRRVYIFPLFVCFFIFLCSSYIFGFFKIIYLQVFIGSFILQLFPDVAPKTAENFRALCTGD